MIRKINLTIAPGAVAGGAGTAALATTSADQMETRLNAIVR
jgi:hypothetical protein